MSIDKVRAYFAGLGMENRIIEFEKSSATVELAAKAAGVIPARICKTICLAGADDGCILVQTAGDTKIKNGKFKRIFGEKPKMLPPEKVLSFTGHAVGGVCAFAIEDPRVRVFADISLKRFDTVFPACGSDNSAIELDCDELFRFSNAEEWIDVCGITEDK